MTTLQINPEDAKNVLPSNSCYLDGRYFNLVFADYPGLLKNPLVMEISEVETVNSDVSSYRRNFSTSSRFHLQMGEELVRHDTIGLLRLVIITPISRHSNLILLNYNEKKMYRFEPLGQNGPYYQEVNDYLRKYMGLYLNLELVEIPITKPLNEQNPDCAVSGFCNAYNILYGISAITGIPFQPQNIRQFVGLIEQTYGFLPILGVDVEMGPEDVYPVYSQGVYSNPYPYSYSQPYSQPYYQQQNNRVLGSTALGGVTGGVLGGLLGGPVGLIGGAVLGAGTGALIGSR